MLDPTDVRTTMGYPHCGLSRTVKKAKNHLIFEPLVLHGNIGKSGMYFAFIGNTTFMCISWTIPSS
jgi:hypothetical protein